MIVAINGRFLSKPNTGIGYYTINLLQQLAKTAPDNTELLVICDQQIELKEIPRSWKLVIRPEHKLLKRIHAGLSKAWWEWWTIPRTARQFGAKLLHSPYPALSKFPVEVMTVHDAIPWQDQAYQPTLASKVLHWFLRFRIRSVVNILTVSATAKKQLVEVLGLTEQNITVIHNGAELPKATKLDYLTKFGLKQNDYLLYFGGFDPRKNVQRIVEICQKYLAHQLDLTLVVAGGAALSSDLYADYNKVKGSKIVRTGFVDEAELACLIKNCWALISLSKNEGFNLPLAQTLQAHKMAIYSAIPVHLEISQGCGLAVDLRLKDQEIANLIADLHQDQELWDQKLAQIKTQKWSYSWEKNAHKTWEIYLSCVKLNSR